MFIAAVLNLATQGQSGICESSGICQETKRLCQPDGINSCFPGSGAVLLKTVTFDGEGAGEKVQTCIRSRCTVPDITSNIILKNITLNYVSMNPRYFKLRVSWSLTESSGYRGGYELRVIDLNDEILLCYCIVNSNRTRVTINGLRYENLKMLKSIDVLPYRHPHINENDIKVSAPLHQNIKGCADVEHNGTICSSKPFPKPENLSVESSVCRNDTKTLNITWDPPNVDSDVPLPEVYHLSLYSNPFNYIYTQRFAVRGANQVGLVHLSATLNYKVYVTPYRMCSGLGSASINLGCGAKSSEFEKRIDNCDSNTPDSITTLYRSEGTVMEQLNVTFDMNLVPVLCVVILLLTLVVTAVVLFVFLYTKLNKLHRSEKHSSNCPTVMVDYKYNVFVFYLSSTSQTHKVYIQKYVICNLLKLKHFKVVTSDDINKGNICKWLEDAVNSADSVLLVGNEEFFSEWGKKECSPDLNSLELLIYAAVSQKTIAKFGFISIGESMTDVTIPDNSYLKLLPVFFMGKKKCEVEEVYRFVTRSRGIELAHEANHDYICKA